MTENNSSQKIWRNQIVMYTDDSPLVLLTTYGYGCQKYRQTIDYLFSVFENFPEGPGRILSNIKDDETRTRALSYVASCLKRKEKVTESDLRATLKGWNGDVGNSCTIGKKGGNLGHVSKNFTNVKTPTEEKPDPAPSTLKDRLTPAPVEPSQETPEIPPHLPPDAPMSEKLKRDEILVARAQAEAACGFRPASHVLKDGLTGGSFIIPPPVKVRKTPLTDEEKKTVADAFVERTGRTPAEIAQIDELVTVQYEGIKSRYGLIDKAISWFLAQAEGE